MLNHFPPSPVQGSSLLRPITSWTQLHDERKATKVEYGMFWDESVHAGVAYFFRWLGEPRATVLTVVAGKELTHVEARKAGDLDLTVAEALPITREVKSAFARAGFVYRPTHQG